MINANKFKLRDIMRFSMNRKQRYMLKEENENELYAQRRRSSRRHKTKTINERKKKKNKIQN